MVVINPADASERGIVDNQVVKIFNDRDSIEAVAKISEDIRQGVVVAPMGYWAKNSRTGFTVNAISPPAFADYGNAPTFSDTLVEVSHV